MQRLGSRPRVRPLLQLALRRIEGRLRGSSRR
jgi:hypothetical protein